MLDRVQKNSSVLVHFILKLADGSTADPTYAQGKPQGGIPLCIFYHQ